MKYMKRMLFSFILGGLALYLTATVFAHSQWEGPLLITFFLFSMMYGLAMLHKWKPNLAKIVFEFLVNCLTWP